MTSSLTLYLPLWIIQKIKFKKRKIYSKNLAKICWIRKRILGRALRKKRMWSFRIRISLNNNPSHKFMPLHQLSGGFPRKSLRVFWKGSRKMSPFWILRRFPQDLKLSTSKCSSPKNTLRRRYLQLWRIMMPNSGDTRISCNSKKTKSAESKNSKGRSWTRRSRTRHRRFQVKLSFTIILCRWRPKIPPTMHLSRSIPTICSKK